MDPIENKIDFLTNPLNTLQTIQNRFYFLGTMHLAQESADLAEKIIKELKPNCIMIELDDSRFRDLLKRDGVKKKSSRQIKSDSDKVQQHHQKITLEKPLKLNDDVRLPQGNPNNDEFFNFLHELQQSLGQALGITPGIEMISTIKTAIRYQIPLLLIDRPIIHTFQRIQELQAVIEQEQEELINSIKNEGVEQKELKNFINDLNKPGMIAQIITEFQQQYPQLFKVLITERNEYMVNQIMLYANNHPTEKYLIIIGAGHLEEIMKSIKKSI